MPQAISSLTVDEHLTYLTKGCVDVIRLDELRRKLERAASAGTPLVVKVGFDPTAPDLHLGHSVLIRKMKHFQDLGHRVVFLIGDFTGLIGDPTGRSKTRPPLSREEIQQNAETYKAQIFKLLDPDRTVIDFNSRWLDELGSEGWVRLAAKYSVAKMLERRDFKQRYERGHPIGIHEFLYPLSQAYDSVVLHADVELGGTDQLFNLNVGRDIMPAFGLEAQVVLTTPLLEGLDGVEKMSKSLNNYVGITEPPAEMFGKLMSISDELMWKYYLLLTDLGPAEIASRQQKVAGGDLHPKQAKVELATLIVRDFHSRAAAQRAAAEFDRLFRQKEQPGDVRAIRVRAPASSSSVAGARPDEAGVLASDPLNRVLVKAGLADSGSDATRKIRHGAVRVNGEKVTQFSWQFPGPGEYMVQVGARQFARFIVED
jgi:tyrosyl-tRNA synthetase